MTGVHWWSVLVLIGNGVGIYPAWQARSPFVMLFCFGVGYALCRLLYLDDKGVGVPTPRKDTP